MAENAAPTAIGADVPGQPFYDKTRQHLKDLLQKKRLLERSLAAQEDAIYKKETDYLEETPSGNIITGFEAYTKATAPGAQRRKAAVSEMNRVFSKSSITYNLTSKDSPAISATSTPVQTNAPTPLSSNFVRPGQGAADPPSNRATPPATNSSAPKAAVVGTSKKNSSSTKRPGGEDSESDAKDAKKVRTNSGPGRK